MTLLCSLGQHHSIWSTGRWHNLHKSESDSMINRDCPVFCMVRIPLLSKHFNLCCVPHAYSVQTEFTLTSMAYTPSQVSKQTPWGLVCALAHILLVAVPFSLKKVHVQEFLLSTYLYIEVCINGCHWGSIGKGGQVMQECHRLPLVRWVFQYLIQSKIYVFIFPFSTGSGGSPSRLFFFILFLLPVSSLLYEEYHLI